MNALSESPYRRGYEPPGTTHTSLIDGLRADDAAKWDRLIRLYGPQVYRWALGKGLRGEDAADVAQEVFHAIARGLGSFERDPARGSFRAWIWRITQRRVVDFRRRNAQEPLPVGGDAGQARLEEIAGVAPDEGPPEEAPGTALASVLDLARGKFAEKTWRAFLLNVMERRCAKDVADELGMSVNSVFISRSRVLNRVRREILNLVRDRVDGPTWAAFEASADGTRATDEVARAVGMPTAEVEAAIVSVLKCLREVQGRAIS